MKNKTLLTVIPVALAAMNVEAGTMGDVNQHQPFNGVYLGLSGGMLLSDNYNDVALYNYNHNWQSFQVINTVRTYSQTFHNENSSFKHGLQSGALEITLGVGQTFVDSFFIGAEAALTLANNNHNTELAQNTQWIVSSWPSYTTYANENITNPITAKINYAEFDLDLKLGTLLAPTTLLYGKVGAAFNHYDLKQQFTYTQLFILQQAYGWPSNYEDMGSVYSEASKTAIGLRVGGGIEQMITDCLSIKLNYMYTWYPSLKTSAIGDVYWLPNNPPEFPEITTITNGISSAVSSKINTQTIMLGVNWYLDNLFS